MPQMDGGSAGVALSLDDVLVGQGCLTFAEGDMDVCVGWLRGGGEGLVVTAHVDEGVVGQVRFWCDAQQWADWIAASLPMPSWEALPHEWRASAASLTLATESTGDVPSDSLPSSTPLDASSPGDEPELHCTSQSASSSVSCAISWPDAVAIAPERVETLWRMGMVLGRNGRQLALHYLDGATAWLLTRCERATPAHRPLDPCGFPERHCVMAAGWAALPASLCDGLLDGGAVLLDVAADVTAGEYWLIDGDDAIAMRDGQPAGRHVVSLDRATDGVRDGGALECPRLLAVIAQRQIPVPWLTAWRCGYETAPPPTTPRALTLNGIALWRDGAPWKSGRLLRFGDGRLAVQIEPANLVTTPSAPDAISGRDPMGVDCATS
ncbi:hypothetical protein [Pandoraea capi]|uniref:hypothetical protein n=1 Tax=Pandoraea capi TaxID=2508286 RepID=UPI00123FE67A|nr:hypothetical protein [Pandoraea capi]